MSSAENDNITSFIKEVNASLDKPKPIAAISATTYVNITIQVWAYGTKLCIIHKTL